MGTTVKYEHIYRAIIGGGDPLVVETALFLQTDDKSAMTPWSTSVGQACWFDREGEQVSAVATANG
jgi:hypothetical protein